MRRTRMYEPGISEAEPRRGETTHQPVQFRPVVTNTHFDRPGGAGGHSLRRTLRAATKLPPGTAQHREGALTTSLHAHATRRRPGHGLLLRLLARSAADTSGMVEDISTTVEKLRVSMEGLEAGLVSQVNTLDQLLAEAQSRLAPYRRPIATRVARGRGL